jgi:hypothetical protein
MHGLKWTVIFAQYMHNCRYMRWDSLYKSYPMCLHSCITYAPLLCKSEFSVWSPAWIPQQMRANIYLFFEFFFFFKKKKSLYKYICPTKLYNSTGIWKRLADLSTTSTFILKASWDKNGKFQPTPTPVSRRVTQTVLHHR